MNNQTIIENLQKHFEENEYFNDWFSQLLEIVKARSVYILKNSYTQEVEDGLYQAMKSHVTHGYDLGNQILTHEESVIEEEFLKQPNDILRQRVPATVQEETDMSHLITDEGRSYSLTMLELNEDSYEVTRSFLRMASYMGIVQRFIDERDKKYPDADFTSDDTWWVGSETNGHFVSPTIMAVPSYHRDVFERWELVSWSGNDLDYPSGVLQVVKLSEEDGGFYLLQVTVPYQLIEQEHNMIIQSLVETLGEKLDVPNSQILVEKIRAAEFDTLHLK